MHSRLDCSAHTCTHIPQIKQIQKWKKKAVLKMSSVIHHPTEKQIYMIWLCFSSTAERHGLWRFGPRNADEHEKFKGTLRVFKQNNLSGFSEKTTRLQVFCQHTYIKCDWCPLKKKIQMRTSEDNLLKQGGYFLLLYGNVYFYTQLQVCKINKL